ncbi:neprilysin-2-like isoform X2 [Stegodyphus dumicola]|uniref:neprilysin-2-like isoform X2 n=1 Tax=Stegodyphus dumicola TaxID=202533 RepID=UPI0015B1A63A|nr:neprilysin-2-like isoform X2 [Stegodyphus dumicola]
MMWRVVLKSLPLLSKDWRALSLEHRRLSLPDADETPRWEECLSYFPAKLELALNSFYLRHYKGKENKAMVTEIAEYIRGEVLNILESSAWLDERTKKNAIDKANAVTFKIAYPEELINETVISLLYPNVKLNKSHFSNRLKILKWLQDHFYVTYQDPTYNKRWHTSGRKSLRVTGIYYPENNVIDMSAGMIQDPYFNKDRPMYLNFGAVGLVIGHEFFHGFAGQGRKYDTNGNKVNWWSNETDSIYEKKALCIIQQYSNYTVGNGMKVNGLNTQPDNIADNAGLKAAYLAYQSWVRIHKTEKMLPGLKYTPNQLFFISAAQSKRSYV